MVAQESPSGDDRISTVKSFSRISLAALVLVLAAVALWPLVDRALAQRHNERRLRSLEGAAAWLPPGHVRCFSSTQERPLLPVREAPPLASWGSIGGCGAGGGAASGPGGGITWVGRNVTGGLLDAQCLTSETLAKGNAYTTVLTRLGASPAQPWGLALYVPVLYKVGDVTVLGQTKTARIAGFGDVSVEASRKLGLSGAHRLAMIASMPIGAHDAVRQGMVLPQHLQLGSGVLGATGQYQYTRDRDWGVMLLGGTINYGGWQNSIGDRRAPSAAASANLGYILGPLVPSVGLTMFGKPVHDRERGADKAESRDPLFTMIPSLGLEWSSDYLALYLAGTLGLSYHGVESTTVGLGVSSSLF
jgi:hypothetical protein